MNFKMTYLNFRQIHCLLDWININEIQWTTLCSNPNAILLLEANKDKINWAILSDNPNAIHLLEANQDKIHWNWLSLNPNIFTYDYKKMKDVCNIYKEELIAYVFHPIRLFKNVTEETDLDEILAVWE